MCPCWYAATKHPIPSSTMAKFDLSTIALKCAKPNCLNGKLQRHHKGSQHMWLRHFADRHRTKKFREFKARYWMFHKEDVTIICAGHHEEIHRRYEAVIDLHFQRSKNKPLYQWTWDEAEQLIKALVAHCDEWLKLETPPVTRGFRYINPNFKRRKRAR